MSNQNSLKAQASKSAYVMWGCGGKRRSRKSRLIKKRGMSYVIHNDRVCKLIKRGYRPF